MLRAGVGWVDECNGLLLKKIVLRLLISVGMKNRNWVALVKGKSVERIGVRSAEPDIQNIR